MTINGYSIRTITDDGTTLYCGSDVAKALGYSRPNNAVHAHCQDVVKRKVTTNGGAQELTFIHERDVRRLIMHSALPNAIAIKEEWFGKPDASMTVFDSDEFGKVRTILRDGEPWFSAADVCRALTIVNVSDAVDTIDESDKVVLGVDEGSVHPLPMNFVNEAAVYELIFKSNKPSAMRFKRWVAHDVLPSIRKHGVYATDALLNDPDLLEARVKQLRAKKETSLNERVSTLTSDNERLTAMVTSYEKKLFIRDHIKDIFDFINKCVRSYAAIEKHGNMGYGWKDYYDRLATELGTDIRERGKPYIDQITDEEMGTAIRVAGKISIRPVNNIVSDELIDIVRRAA